MNRSHNHFDGEIRLRKNLMRIASQPVQQNALYCRRGQILIEGDITFENFPPAAEQTEGEFLVLPSDPSAHQSGHGC